MKKSLGVILVLIFAFAFIRITTFTYENIKRKNNVIMQDNETVTGEHKTESAIIPISVDEVKGITKQEAEEICYYVFGEKDEDTGFVFSFGTSGAVQKDEKQYYVIRASWLVDNNHLSYIGDFFVSADGNEIYDGAVMGEEYEMMDLVWKK
ncbi:MAG: hypothetical protein IJC06_00075 [Clostridia bacterium]|nr:hypothetical protein [Clostridia bacterium]